MLTALGGIKLEHDSKLTPNTDSRSINPMKSVASDAMDEIVGQL
jgi:hypothetical protein